MKFSLLFTSFIPMSLALIAGMAVPFQAASNVALGRALGHPLWATLTSLIISIIVLIPILIIIRPQMPNIQAALQGPIWLWIGGVLGVAYITAALIITPKIGIASFMICVIIGQIIASLLLDATGIMGLLPRAITTGKIIGTALMIIGLVIFQWSAMRK